MSIVDCRGGNFQLPGGDTFDSSDESALMQPWEAPMQPTWVQFGPLEEMLGGADPSVSGLDGVGGLMAGLSALIVGIVVCALVVMLLLFVATSALTPGYLRMHQQAAGDGPVAIESLFSPGAHFVPVLATKFLRGLIMSLFLVLLVVLAAAGIAAAIALDAHATVGLIALGVAAVLSTAVGLYLALGLTFATQAVVFENLAPMQALKRSWQLARGIRFQLLWYFVLAFLVALAGVILGVLALCVGLLFTVPIARMVNDCTKTLLFLQRTSAAEPSSD